MGRSCTRFLFVQFLLNMTWKFPPLSNLCDNLAQMICDIFWFNVICHRWSLTTVLLIWRLVESDVTVTPSVMCVDWLCWWYNHAANVLPSTTLAFVTKMTEKCNSTSPSAIQVKNWWKTVNTEEKLNVINQLKKDEQIADLCRNVRSARIGVCTIHDTADRITESA
jgi:hypothetical protein